MNKDLLFMNPVVENGQECMSSEYERDEKMMNAAGWFKYWFICQNDDKIKIEHCLPEQAQKVDYLWCHNETSFKLILNYYNLFNTYSYWPK